MAKVRTSAIESLRPGLGRIEREEEAEGLHQGREAFRYSADGTAERTKPLGVRAVWVRGKGVLYSVVIHGRDRLALDALFPKLLDGLRIAD
jgi:hypothetical protein